MFKNFDYLNIPRRSSKPRRAGVTLIRDQGLGLHQVLDILQAYGEYLDYVKIKQFELWYMNPSNTVDKIKLYSGFDVKPFCGGTVIEAAWLKNKVSETFEELREMGFANIELSDNIIEISIEEKKQLIKSALEYGFDVMFEYGKKYPDGPLDVDEAITEMNTLLEAGAKHMIVERAILDITLGPNGEKDEVAKLKEMVDAVGLDSLIFEAETFGQQIQLIKAFGPDVSIGPNLSPDYVISKLEPARYGLGRDEGFSFFQKIK